jgi:hypothetical protein
MTPSAQPSIFSVSFGQASIRGLYLDGVTTSVVALSERRDPLYGLSVATKLIEDKIGHKINPAEVIISGSKSIIDIIASQIKAEVVPEEKAIAAAEKYLTAAMSSPAAVLDLGPSAFLDHGPAEEIGRWLPFTANLSDIENYLAGKRLFPRVVPVTEHEYQIDLSVARQAIIKLGQKEGKEYLPVSSKLNLIITGGLLTSITDLSDLVLVLLDSFYFRSGVSVYLDTSGDLIPAGAIFSRHEDRELSLTNSLRQIGSLLHLGGAHELTIDFGYESKQRLRLLPGEIVGLPVGAGIEMELIVDTGRSKHEYKLLGGEGGVYLDNRPRPLGLVAGSKDSISKIQNWRKSLSGERLFAEAG